MGGRADTAWDPVVNVLLIAAAALLVAAGLVAFRAAWLCYRSPERAGWWTDPRSALVLLVFLATMTGPMMIWIERGAIEGWGNAAYRAAAYVVGVLLCIPFMAYHAGALVERAFTAESQPPPEPEDPFERARASEERGDVRGAIERYSFLLDEEPSHAEARMRLAELLARTRRAHQAAALVEQGLEVEGTPPAASAELKAMLLKLQEEIQERSG
jgi:hypothetical protein